MRAGTALRIVEPAYRLDAAERQRAGALLAARGIAVEEQACESPGHGRLSAGDARRAAELQAAFADPAVGAILVGQGGYGCLRLLERLDWREIARQPKPLIGFSDVTALLIAGLRALGTNGVHGPTARTLAKHADAASLDGLAAVLRADWDAYNRVLAGARPQIRVLRAGTAEAPILGGNLSLLASLAGTPFDAACEGTILFIEDWSEPHYRIDRMLTQLHLAGKLARLEGLVLGEMVEIAREGEDIAETIEERLLALLPPGIPVVAGFPCGHGRCNVPLLEGARYALAGAELRLVPP